MKITATRKKLLLQVLFEDIIPDTRSVAHHKFYECLVAKCPHCYDDDGGLYCAKDYKYRNTNRDDCKEDNDANRNK